MSRRGAMVTVRHEEGRVRQQLHCTGSTTNRLLRETGQVPVHSIKVTVGFAEAELQHHKLILEPRE